MKKIITLLISVILFLSFSVTVFAEGESSSSGSQNLSDSLNSSEQGSSNEVSTSSEKVDIPAKPTLQIIEIPRKTVYELGEKLDLTGLKVNITTEDRMFISNNGTGLTTSVTAFNKEGKQTVELKYNDIVASFEVTVKPKHIHKYEEWIVQNKAYCEIEGKKARKCECGNIESAVIPPLGHDWDEGTILKEATTKSEGLIKYTCIRCRAEKSDKIPIIKKEKIKFNFKFELKWWMVFVPIGLTIIFYIWALKKIFKKKA